MYLVTVQALAIMLATLSQGRLLKSPSDLVGSRNQTLSLAVCIPNTWACSLGKIWVCNRSGNWVPSAVCGGNEYCSFASNGQPFCTCYLESKELATMGDNTTNKSNAA
jgi:hypothetical protein